jgi:hypothetical protein
MFAFGRRNENDFQIHGKGEHERQQATASQMCVTDNPADTGSAVSAATVSSCVSGDFPRTEKYMEGKN